MTPPTSSPASRTVLIGSEALLDAWIARASHSTDVIPIPSTDLEMVLETIAEEKPLVIVIEQTVAASGAGAVLMDRLHADRLLNGTEVRLLTPARASDLMSSEPRDVNPERWLSELADPLPPRPERRTARFRAAKDERVMLNGYPVDLIDLSADGAQIRSATILRPKQRVRIVLPPERGSVRTAAVVVWSQFDLSDTAGYRAGVAFARAIPDPAEGRSVRS